MDLAQQYPLGAWEMSSELSERTEESSPSEMLFGLDFELADIPERDFIVNSQGVIQKVSSLIFHKFIELLYNYLFNLIPSLCEQIACFEKN